MILICILFEWMIDGNDRLALFSKKIWKWKNIADTCDKNSKISYKSSVVQKIEFSTLWQRNRNIQIKC